MGECGEYVLISQPPGLLIPGSKGQGGEMGGLGGWQGWSMVKLGLALAELARAPAELVPDPVSVFHLELIAASTNATPKRRANRCHHSHVCNAAT